MFPMLLPAAMVIEIGACTIETQEKAYEYFDCYMLLPPDAAPEIAMLPVETLQVLRTCRGMSGG